MTRLLVHQLGPPLAGLGLAADLPSTLRAVRDDLTLDLDRRHGEGVVRRGPSTELAEDARSPLSDLLILNALGPPPTTDVVSAISPTLLPLAPLNEIMPESLGGPARPFDVVRLDATADPGTGGRRLYETEAGRVVT
ncbi:MAG: hypothetical protein MUC77_02505 [Chromatiaceae bacterium]|jgi:hypothetical protein|nr:hypothetical protein [Chromatiaceae bacterium]